MSALTAGRDEPAATGAIATHFTVAICWADEAAVIAWKPWPGPSVSAVFGMLRVSPAAISGAMRYLVNARMVSREREPGQRADVYRIHDDDVWGRIMSARVPILEQWETTLADAIAEIGSQSRGGRRLQETKEFYAFMRQETEEMLVRWAEHRQSLS